MATYYLPYLEMRDSRLGFTIAFLTLLFTGVVSGFTPCGTTADCDRSLEFCDTSASWTCMSCEHFPCLKTDLEENGGEFCRQVCPVFWENMQNTIAPSVGFNETKPHEQGDAQELVDGHREGVERQNEKSTAGHGNMVSTSIALGVVVAICVVVGSGIFIYMYYKKKRARKSQEETAYERGSLVI